MKRSLPQNEVFHCFCREIALHLCEANVNCSEVMVKELIKTLLGNTTELLSTTIAMPTSSYKRSDEDLTQEELDSGVLSMEALLNKMVVWASTDLNLELVSLNE